MQKKETTKPQNHKQQNPRIPKIQKTLHATPCNQYFTTSYLLFREI